MEFIESLKNRFPHKLTQLEFVGKLYQQKLWHQLSIELSLLLQNQNFLEGEESIQIYTEFISNFEGKLNGFQFVDLITLVGKKLGSSHLQLSLYERILESDRKFDAETILCIQMCVAYTYVSIGNQSKAYSLLVEGKEKIVAGNLSSSPVLSRYYRAFAEYHQAKGNYTEFYTAALLYLSYSKLEVLSIEEKKHLAVRIALASVLSDSVFDFAVFLQSQLLQFLEGPYLWLKNLVYIMNNGMVLASLQLLQDHRQEILELPELFGKLESIKWKVVCLSVLNMVLARSPHGRNISFQDIAEVSLVPKEQVENVIMKLMSLNLLKGKIDQVGEKVKVEWIQPRELDQKSIASIGVQLADWTESVKKALNLVEESSPELYV